MSSITDQDSLSTPVALSSARVYDSLKQSQDVVSTLAPLVKESHSADATDDVLEIRELLTKHGGTDQARALAKKFLETNPQHPRALFEWAAVLAQEDKEKDAISLLGQAISSGGAPYKAMARTDKRFDEIRDQRSFRKLVSP